MWEKIWGLKRNGQEADDHQTEGKGCRCEICSLSLSWKILAEKLEKDVGRKFLQGVDQRTAMAPGKGSAQQKVCGKKVVWGLKKNRCKRKAPNAPVGQGLERERSSVREACSREIVIKSETSSGQTSTRLRWCNKSSG